MELRNQGSSGGTLRERASEESRPPKKHSYCCLKQREWENYSGFSSPPALQCHACASYWCNLMKANCQGIFGNVVCEDQCSACSPEQKKMGDQLANHQLFLTLLIQKTEITPLVWVSWVMSALTSNQDSKHGRRIYFLLALSFSPAVIVFLMLWDFIDLAF